MQAKGAHSVHIYSFLHITQESSFKLIVIKCNEESNNYESSRKYNTSVADVHRGVLPICKQGACTSKLYILCFCFGIWK